MKTKLKIELIYKKDFVQFGRYEIWDVISIKLQLSVLLIQQHI